MKPSERPWEVKPYVDNIIDEEYEAYFTSVYAPRRMLVAYVTGDNDPEQQANAALIVRAVNSHEALRAACQSALRAIVLGGDGVNWNTIVEEMQDALKLSEVGE